MSQQLNPNVPYFICQGSPLPGIIYIGMTPTTECDQFCPNVFQQPFYNLHHDHNNRNATNYYWSYDKQESSRSFTIGPILNKREPLKQFPIS